MTPQLPVGLILLAIFVLILLFKWINILNEYERAVIFTLGRVDKDPKGPETGTKRVLRGSGWQNETPTVRIFTRVDSDPLIRNESTGFRCARDK